MVFSVLHKNSPYIIFVIPLFALVLWLKFLIAPTHELFYYDQNPMPLYKVLLNFKFWGSYALPISNLFWLALNSILLSRLNSMHRLIEKGTFIFIFIYIVISASFPALQQGNPIQPALTFIILGVTSIFKMYKNERGLQPVFEAGLFFSIASLFYANSIFLSLFIFFALFSLVPLNWRQWTSGLIGILTPLFVVFAIFFVQDELPNLLYTIKENTVIWKKPKEFHYTQFILAGILAFIMLGSIINSFSSILKKVSSKKYYGLFLTQIILVIGIYLAVPAAGTEFFFFTIIAIVFYTSNYMINMRSRSLQELYMYLIIIAGILVQVLN